MTAVAVIPGRLGSKRLSRKPLRLVGGRTLIDHALDVAEDAGLFDRIVVATPDDEIAALAHHRGVEICGLSEDLAGDLVSSADIALEAASDAVAVGYLASAYPLLSAADVRGAWDRFIAAGAGCAISVTSIDPHDFHWALVADGEFAAPYFPAWASVDRALLPPVWSPTGAIKIARTDELRAHRTFLGPRLVPVEIPRVRSLYVRDEADLRMAEALRAEMVAS